MSHNPVPLMKPLNPGWVTIALAIAASTTLCAQTPAVPSKSTSDLNWIRDYAISPISGQRGRQNELNWDPRFVALLRSSFPQRQNFWLDHGHFTPLPDLIHTFTGIPGDVLLDENRYITADGCVPHDCGDQGMLWIDTDSGPKPSLVFVATGMISDGPADHGRTLEHLWLFASVKLDWQKMPPAFLTSLTRWSAANLVKGYPETVVLVTLVQRNGQTVDLAPSNFSLVTPPVDARK